MEKKKKVYYISDIAKAYDLYNESYVDKVEDIFKSAFFGVVTCVSLSTLTTLFNGDLSVVDKAKALILGLGVPAVTIPATVMNIKNAIASTRRTNKIGAFIDENRRDITDEELDEYLEDKFMENSVRTLK